MSEQSGYTCFNCGVEIPKGGGHTVGKEAPSFSMHNPYPGYEGDPVCDDCYGDPATPSHDNVLYMEVVEHCRHFSLTDGECIQCGSHLRWVIQVPQRKAENDG